MFSINWKSRTTWTGIAAIVAAVGAYVTGEMEMTAAFYAVLGGLAVVFGRAAIKPVAALLVCGLLVGCQTLPADQSAKDEAGRSEVTEKQVNESYRILLPRNMTITFQGDVGNVTLVDQSGNERSADQSQTNSGSTTTETAKTQGQTQTPTSTLEVPVDVSGLPGQ